MSTQQTIEQLRANKALAFVRGVPGTDLETIKEAVTSLPALVLMNGLGQAMAFAKADKASRPIYDELSKWLCGSGPQAIFSEGDLLQMLVKGNQDNYRAAHAEALALLQWIKHMARAEGGK